MVAPLWVNGLAAAPGEACIAGLRGGVGPSRERHEMDFTRRLCQAPAGHFANNLVSLNPVATFEG